MKSSFSDRQILIQNYFDIYKNALLVSVILSVDEGSPLNQFNTYSVQTRYIFGTNSVKHIYLRERTEFAKRDYQIHIEGNRDERRKSSYSATPPTQTTSIIPQSPLYIIDV